MTDQQTTPTTPSAAAQAVIPLGPSAMDEGLASVSSRRLWWYAGFYFLTPALAVIGERLDGVTLDQIDGAQWIVISICAFTAGAVSVRGFFDSSFARYKAASSVSTTSESKATS